MTKQQEANLLAKLFQEMSNIECEVVFYENGDTHVPSTLNDKEQGVYVFISNNGCFKVGKAGSKSKARWNSHHYNPNSSNSNLSKSILSEKFKTIELFPNDIIKIESLNDNNIGGWIKNNLSRIEFKIDESEGKLALNFLEAFIQFKYKPIYEGHKSQK